MLTLAAVADHKGIALTTLEVEIARVTSPGSRVHTRFDVDIDLGEGLSRRERIILLNSARRCDVFKLLSGEIEFSYQLVAGEPA